MLDACTLFVIQKPHSYGCSSVYDDGFIHPLLDKMAAISQTTLSNAFGWMKSFSTSHYLNQCWPSSPTQICSTMGRWVNRTDQSGLFKTWLALALFTLHPLGLEGYCQTSSVQVGSWFQILRNAYVWNCWTDLLHEHDNQKSNGWIVLKFGTHIGNDIALSWLIFQGHGSKFQLKASEKVMILVCPVVDRGISRWVSARRT